MKKLIFTAAAFFFCFAINAQTLLLTRSSTESFDSNVRKVLSEKMDYIQSGVFSYLFESGFIVFDDVTPIEAENNSYILPVSLKGLASYIAVIRIEPDSYFAEAVLFNGQDMKRLETVTAEFTGNQASGSKKESYISLGKELGSKILEIVN